MERVGRKVKVKGNEERKRDSVLKNGRGSIGKGWVNKEDEDIGERSREKKKRVEDNKKDKRR